MKSATSIKNACYSCGLHTSKAEQYEIFNLGPELLSCFEEMFGSTKKVGLKDHVCKGCLLDLQKTLSSTDIKSEKVYVEESDLTVFIKQENDEMKLDEENPILEESEVFNQSLADSSFSEIDSLQDIKPTLDENGMIELNVKCKAQEMRCIRCKKMLRKGNYRMLYPRHRAMEELIKPVQVLFGDRACLECFDMAQLSYTTRSKFNKDVKTSEKKQLELSVDKAIDSKNVSVLKDCNDESDHSDVKDQELDIIDSQNKRAASSDWDWEPPKSFSKRLKKSRPLSLSDSLPSSQPKEKCETIQLKNYKRVPSTSRACIYPNCTGKQRLIIPANTRHVLLKYKVYVPASARICENHRNADAKKFPVNEIKLTEFTAAYLEDMMDLISAEGASDDFSFNNPRINPCIMKYLVGYTEKQMRKMYQTCPNLEKKKVTETTFCLFLVKLKSGDSSEKVCSLLQEYLPRTTLEKSLRILMKTLSDDFVPLHLGLNVSVCRKLLAPEALFGRMNHTWQTINGKLVCFLRHSISETDNDQQTAKPMLVVTSNGYILNVIETVDFNKTEAEVLNILFDEQDGLLNENFVDDDIFIIDKGNKDFFAIGYVYNYYFQSKNSSSEPDDTIISKAKDNRPKCLLRCLTMSKTFQRRFSDSFKQVLKVWETGKKAHLLDLLRIAAALINAYHPLMKLRNDEELF